MLGAELSTTDYFFRLKEELDNLVQSQVTRLADAIFRAWEQERFVYVIGNGGSATTATHICEDLGKGLLQAHEFHDDSKKRLKVLSLTDNSGWILAIGNDIGYDQIFKQQLMNFAKPGDLVIAISGSGNSANILNAVEWANENELHTFGLTGFDGGKLKGIQHDGLHIAVDDMGMVESLHLCAFHWVIDDLYARINAIGKCSSM